MKSIYAAGGITGLTEEEANTWRRKLKDDLWGAANVFNPMDHFKTGDDELVAMRYDLHRLRNSDLVVLTFNSVYSLGSMAELAIAYELNIPVIGLNEDHNQLHPWQVGMCQIIFENYDEMIDYIRLHYINED